MELGNIFRTAVAQALAQPADELVDERCQRPLRRHEPLDAFRDELAELADVLLAVGCRFTDWSASSYRRDVSFSIPPTRLIHVDIDPHEIGKNYPCEVALVGDARAALTDLLEAAAATGRPDLRSFLTAAMDCLVSLAPRLHMRTQLAHPMQRSLMISAWPLEMRMALEGQPRTQV